MTPLVIPSPHAPFLFCQSLPTYAEPFFWLHFDHPPQEALAVRGDEVWHVEDPAFHLLQQLAQVVVIEGQGPLCETLPRPLGQGSPSTGHGPSVGGIKQ